MLVDCCVGGGWYFLYYSYRRNPTGQEFFVPAGTLIVVKLLTVELENVQACCWRLDATGKTGGGGRLKMKATTRWTSLEGLLKSHIDCIEVIHQVIYSHPERDISNKTTLWDFVKKIMKHLPYLTHLKSALVLMQKRMTSLEEFQFHCDLVASYALIGYGKAGNDCCYCK